MSSEVVSVTTFNGTPIGNLDSWVKTQVVGGMLTVEVHASYLPPNTIPGQMRPADRLAAQNYFKDLVFSCTNNTQYTPIDPINVTHDSRKTVYFPKHADAAQGDLRNDYFDCFEELGVYLIDAKFSDSGWHGYDFVLTFAKQADPLISTQLMTFNGVTLGNRQGWVQGNYDSSTGSRVFIAQVFYVVPIVPPGGQERLAAEEYVQGLASNFKPRALKVEDGKTYPVNNDAVKATLVNNASGLNVPNLYCTNITHRDDGNYQYAITLTFQEATGVPDDGDDSLIPRFSIGCVGQQAGIQIGNMVGQLDIRSDWDFERFVVKGKYVAPEATPEAKYYYGTVLTQSLGTTHNRNITLMNAKGRVMTACSQEGCLYYDNQVFSKLYLENISSNLIEGVVEISATFIRGRSDGETPMEQVNSSIDNSDDFILFNPGNQP